MTDKERIEILKRVKRQILTGKEPFICLAIDEGLVEVYKYSNLWQDTEKQTDRALRVFPELRKHRPRKVCVHNVHGWFYGIKPRIIALNSMIKEIKAKL